MVEVFSVKIVPRELAQSVGAVTKHPSGRTTNGWLDAVDTRTRRL